MTEAISLALIALVGMVLFVLVSINLVKIILQTKPTHVQLWTKFGWLNVDFDTKTDK